LKVRGIGKIYLLVLTFEVPWLEKVNRNLPLGVFFGPMDVQRPICYIHGLISPTLGA